MRKLVDAAENVYSDVTERYDEKQIANAFWKAAKASFLSGGDKFRIADYAEQIIRKSNPERFWKKHGIKLANVKKSKAQLHFMSEALAMLFKNSGIKFLD